MKINAIRISRTSQQKFGGFEKYTAIVKQPVEGPIKVTPEGLEGNDVGNPKYHGGRHKAIYAYGAQHYTWWRATYPELEFPEGIFGENLVVEGLDEQQVSVGDQFRIGDVILRATTPRIACQTLAAVIGDPAFGKKFAHGGRPGIYFEVMIPGEIAPGMAMERIKNGAAGLTQAEAFALYMGQSQDADQRSKAAQEPTLPEDWREKIG